LQANHTEHEWRTASATAPVRVANFTNPKGIYDMKKVLAISALALSSLTMLSARTYQILLTAPTKAGSVQLKPGQYSVKVVGSNVTFTDENSSKTFTTPAKIETVDKKYDDTKVQSTKDGDTDRLEEIDLGGSKTKLGF